MTFRNLTLVAVVTAIVVPLAACGTDDPSTSPPGERYDADADVAVVRIGRPEFVPTIVIGGDGWVYMPADSADDVSAQGFSRPTSRSVPAIAPARPEPAPMERRQLTPAGVESVLARAGDLGLLAVPDEYSVAQITDAGSTFVSFDVAGGTFEHEAYALGLVDEDGNRKNLADFVDEMGDLEALVGRNNIGLAEPYAPSMYRVTTLGSYGTEGFEVTWPIDVAIEDGCVVLPADRFADGISGIHVADVDGQRIRVVVVPDLPGDDCD